MKKLDLVGKKYGLLTVIEDRPATNAGHITWLCKCDCGNEVIRTGTSITRSKYSSCGCWSRFGKDNPNWNGVGDISAAWFANVIGRAASGRKSRSGIVKKIDIDIQFVWDLFLKQERKCALSGIELTFPIKGTNEEYKRATASLDRIDSRKGYLKDNVQWVHKKINIMKNVFDKQTFVTMCQAVAENFKNK
jgi:hypothetical protein